MSAAGRPRPATAGFTLIEMLVVLGIMALVGGIGFPAMERVRTRQIAAAASDAVTAALRHARSAALGEDRSVTVGFLAGPRVLVSDAAAPLALPVAATVSWPRRGVTFYPDGTASGGTAILAIAGVRPLRVAIDAATGRMALAR